MPEPTPAQEAVIEDMIAAWVEDDPINPHLERYRRAFREDCLRLIAAGNPD